MNLIQEIFSDRLTYALSNALLHSLWQGGLLAFMLATALYFMRDYTARLRYNLVTLCLFTFFGGSVATGIYSYYNWAPPAGFQALNDRELAMMTLPDGLAETSLIKQGLQSDNGLVYAFSYALTLYRQSAPLVLTVWLIGMLLFTVKLSTGLAYTYKLRSSGIPERVPGEWKQKSLDLASRIGIRTAFDVAESRLAETPMVVGIIRPMILLPLGTFTGTVPAHLEAILAHELAHIKRRDYLVNLFMQIVETVYFFHPAAWFMLEIARTEREHCCDDMAVRLTGTPVHLVRALGELGLRQAGTTSLAMGLGQKKTGIASRMKRLLGQNTGNRYLGERVIAAVILIITAGALHVSAIPEDRPTLPEGDPLEVPAVPEVPVPAEPGTSIPPADYPEAPEYQDTTRQESMERRAEAMRRSSERLREKAERLENFYNDPARKRQFEAFNEIIEKMEQDGLIDEDQAYTFTFTEESLTVNGDKQSDKVYRKYRKMYEKATDTDKDGKFEFKWSVSHDPEMEGNGLTGLSGWADEEELEEHRHLAEEMRRDAFELVREELKVHQHEFTDEHRKAIEEARRDMELHREEMQVELRREMERVYKDSAIWKESIRNARRDLENLRRDSTLMSGRLTEAEREAMRDAMAHLQDMDVHMEYQKEHLERMMEHMKNMNLDSILEHSMGESQKALDEVMKSLDEVQKKMEEEDQ